MRLAAQRVVVAALFRGIHYPDPPKFDVVVARGEGEILAFPLHSFEQGLTALGIEIMTGYKAENTDEPRDITVVGNTIMRGNPELEEVLNRKIPYTSAAATVKEEMAASLAAMPQRHNHPQEMNFTCALIRSRIGFFFSLKTTLFSFDTSVTASPTALLTTIRSRCHTVTFTALSEAFVVDVPPVPFVQGERLFGCGVRHLLPAPAAERAAGGGEQDAADAGRARTTVVTGGQALEDGVVLAVDGQQRRAVHARQFRQHRAGQHHRFLVGQQQALAGARGSEARLEAGRAHDGCHDDIDIRVRGHLGQRSRPLQHFSAAAGRSERILQRLGARGIGQHGEARLPLQALRQQLGDPAVGRQGNDFIAIRVPGQHVERAGADAAGGTENTDPLSGRR